MASPRAMTTKKPSANRYPFGYFGEGSTRPIRAKDGLMALVVFSAPLSRAESKAVAATAPPPMQSIVKAGARWLSLETTGTPPSAKALTSWIEGVHGAHPVALFFVGSDGKRGPWHVDTVKRFGERVRPVIEMLRAEGARDHADWIATSFLRSGAATSFEDIRALADEDPPEHVGNIGRRCLLALPLVEALGPASLSALGPYGELGFWACASISELVPDLAAHARHVVSLADACPANRKGAVQHLLIKAACSAMLDAVPLMVRVERPARTPHRRAESFDAALSLAGRAASSAALPVGLLETLVDAARSAGGATRAVALAEPFLAATIAATSATARDRGEEEELARLVSVTTQLANDLETAPSAKLAGVLARAPTPEPEEASEDDDATHPHLARLNTERLTVRYRGSSEPQQVTIEITGSPRPARAKHYLGRVRDVVSLVHAGLAGGGTFAPETGRAEIVEGSTADDTGRDFRWTLRVQGVDPSFWAVALHLLGNPWDGVNMMREVKDCPKHIGIVGALPLDDSPASARTEDVLRWLRDPTPAFRAYPEPPFAVRDEKSSKTAFVLRPEQMSKKLEERVQSLVYLLPNIFTAHPESVRAMLVASPAVGKTQIKVSWFKEPLPAKVTRGPILNMARRLHFELARLSAVSLA